GECMSRLYSSRRGPVPRLTNELHVAGLPVKSLMRPPNSADCLTTQGPPISPSLCSVVTQVASASDFRAESTATPRSGGRTLVSLFSAAGFLSLSDDCCCAEEESAGSLGACAKTTGPNSPTARIRRRAPQV